MKIFLNRNRKLISSVGLFTFLFTFKTLGVSETNFKVSAVIPEIVSQRLKKSNKLSSIRRQNISHQFQQRQPNSSPTLINRHHSVNSQTNININFNTIVFNMH
ncbi:MAG: hypothetical protein LBT82_03920 [Oscillospiraceae bacterium]|jgi:hypothetical protein|nr:hypothetical protein [Oscillospiraceae bacterium]